MSDILVQYQRFSLPSVQANLILRRPGRKRGIKPLADIKAGAPFGMDGAMLSKIDWTLALKRVSHDLRTDFIYAPHLGCSVPECEGIRQTDPAFREALW